MTVTTENGTGEMGWISRSLAYKLNFPPPHPLKRKTQPKICHETETSEIKISNHNQEREGRGELAKAGLEKGVTLISGRMSMCCSCPHHQQHK